jgi:hypothetical protein
MGTIIVAAARIPLQARNLLEDREMQIEQHLENVVQTSRWMIHETVPL